MFDEDVIRPEKQDMQIFAEGMQTITDTNARVANMYLEVCSGDTTPCRMTGVTLHVERVRVRARASERARAREREKEREKEGEK